MTTSPSEKRYSIGDYRGFVGFYNFFCGFFAMESPAAMFPCDPPIIYRGFSGEGRGGVCWFCWLLILWIFWVVTQVGLFLSRHGRDCEFDDFGF